MHRMQARKRDLPEKRLRELSADLSAEHNTQSLYTCLYTPSTHMASRRTMCTFKAHAGAHVSAHVSMDVYIRGYGKRPWHGRWLVHMSLPRVNTRVHALPVYMPRHVYRHDGYRHMCRHAYRHMHVIHVYRGACAYTCPYAHLYMSVHTFMHLSGGAARETL